LAVRSDACDDFVMPRQEADLRLLVAEQAALNRVAVAVATETAAERVFDVVTEEVARVLGADAANLVRFSSSRQEGVIVGKWSEPGVQIPGAGTIVTIEEGSALTRVARTGATARQATDDPGVPPELHKRLTALGVTSLVAAPIVVSGDIWGAVVVSLTGDRRFPADAEERLGQFAALVAVALANTQAREELATLADEQAALSRVAVAVATEENPELLFNAVSEEIGRLFGARVAATVRYVGDADGAEIVGGWDRDGGADAPLGVLVPTPRGAIARVAETGRTIRIDLESEPPELQEHMVAMRVSSAVASPIVVSGRLWGATSITIDGAERFPPDVQSRLEKFTNLVAVALANAEAREELAALAREQAALSRVAVAAATEPPARLFNVVTEEVGRLFAAHWAATVRYVEGSNEVELVGRWHRTGDHVVELGSRLTLGGGVVTRVRETGGPARIDYEQEPPEIQEMMRFDGVASGVAAPIVVSGHLWGAMSISVASPDEFAAGVETEVAKFTNLVSVALGNAEAHEQLTASRARIVQAGDAERQRLERNLHDGAQQRFVSLALGLRLAQSQLAADPASAADLLAQASEELALGLEELRELARGIHPAILTDRGLAPAVEALATRATLPVAINGVPSERLPEPIEAAAFYVVSESLTNIAKYASASRAQVDLAREDGLLLVEVSDDGVGGADPVGGSGLRGLADRVEALGGRLEVSSEPGRGTTVRAELPLDAPA
jgi:signal transduction histidine kinase